MAMGSRGAPAAGWVRLPLRRWAPLLLLAVVVAGCHHGPGRPAPAAGTAPGATAATAATAAPVAPSSTATTLPAGLEAHAGDLSLRVTSVTVGEDTVTVGFVAVNAGATPMLLNHADDLVVQDDAGGRHPLSPPPGNPDVRLPARSRSQGLLVFGGAIPAGTATLTLIANSSFDGTRYTDHPRLVVERIPVAR